MVAGWGCMADTPTFYTQNDCDMREAFSNSHRFGMNGI